MGLEEYKSKRNFKSTTEPAARALEKLKKRTTRLSFVVQKHAASHLHYDFRLELDGVLKSWAVPRGPSLDSRQKRLAVKVEDHPLEYAKFEGEIPKGEYGAGEVIVWDEGTWEAVGDPHRGLRIGRLDFSLRGEKLKGRWILIRTRRGGAKSQWLLMKRADDEAVPESKYRVTDAAPESVITGRTLPGERAEKSWPAKRRLSQTPRIGFTAPQLARLAEKPPTGSEWVHEVKFDGYRTLAQISKGTTRLFTRSGLDWTKKYGKIAEEVGKIPVISAWVDGEIAYTDEKGLTRFHLLQEALKTGKTSSLIYYVFDLLELNGEDLRGLPLSERKKRLAGILSRVRSPHILYSDHWSGSGASLLANGCKMGLEGIISKDKTTPYISGRGLGWVKTKCVNEEDFLICGYVEGEARAGFRSLILGTYQDGILTYVGRVGTGFKAMEMREILTRLKEQAKEASPFKEKVSNSSNVKWVKPSIIARVEFRGWTRDKLLRHASFQGLEKLVKVTRLTHPDKVLIPRLKITKQDIVDYYLEIQKWILPHVKDRPLSLFRCPDGVLGSCFFQKNFKRYCPPELTLEEIVSPKGVTTELVYLDSIKGLAALGQMDVLEIHAWGCRRKDPLKPDLIVFDLDPGPGVPWKNVVEAAKEVRKILRELGLEAFVKTSGGKGFHIHVPIRPKNTWDEVKNFAKWVALYLAEKKPDGYVATATMTKRKGKIFIDYLRNGYGATSVAPYSLRANKDGCIAMPISWNDVGRVNPCEYDLRTALTRLRSIKKDPWEGYFSLRQKLPEFE